MRILTNFIIDLMRQCGRFLGLTSSMMLHNINAFHREFFFNLCNTPVLTPWYWIAYDVNSVNKSWCGAQGKGPTMDLVFYVSVIKIDADGYCASQQHNIILDIM